MRCFALTIASIVLGGPATARDAERVTIDAFAVLTAHGSVVANTFADEAPRTTVDAALDANPNAVSLAAMRDQLAR